MEIDIPQGGGPQGTQDAGPAHRPAAQQVGRQGVRRTPEEQQAEGRQDQPRQRPGEGWLSLLQGSHPPGHEQGRHRPAGESLVDEHEHLPAETASCRLRQEQDGGKDGEGQEKSRTSRRFALPAIYFFSARSRSNSRPGRQ